MDLLQILVGDACPDLSEQLDVWWNREYPRFPGGFGDIYQVPLTDGTMVAAKCLRLAADPDSTENAHLTAVG
jgi:hypothetical protein